MIRHNHELLVDKLAEARAEIARLQNTLKLHSGDCQSLNGEVTMFKERAEEAEAELYAVLSERNVQAAEIERLTTGFTRFIQDSNGCPITGVFCRPECGCDLEMKDWIKWTVALKDTKP